MAYLDAHRDMHGIEPICATLPIAPSTDWRHKAQQTDPTQRRSGGNYAERAFRPRAAPSSA